MRRNEEIEEQEEMGEEATPVRSRSTIKHIRYLLLLIMVMVALILLFANRDQINEDNFRRLMAKINLGVSSSTSADGEIQFDPGKTIVYKDGFAHVSVENLLVTDKNGTEFQNAPLGYRNPCVSTNNHRILVYDSDGTGLMVADSFNVLFETQTEDPIIAARMNDDGYLAVITEGVGSLAKVIVYDSSYNEIYRYRSLNRYLVDAAVTADNNAIVISAMNVEGSEIVPEILYFYLDEEELQWSVPFNEGSPCVRLVAKDDGSICGLFSWGMVSLDDDGDENGRYLFENQVLQCYSMEDGGDNVFILSASANGDSKVLICDEDGDVEDSFDLDYYAVDVDYCEGRVAVLGNMKCTAYDGDGDILWENSTEKGNEIFFMEKSAVVVVSDTGCIYNEIN